jgi:hypothetical protein
MGMRIEMLLKNVTLLSRDGVGNDADVNGYDESEIDIDIGISKSSDMIESQVHDNNDNDNDNDNDKIVTSSNPLHDGDDGEKKKKTDKLDKSTEDKVSLSSSSSMMIKGMDVSACWSGIFACYPIMVLTICVFWGALFFDMISDNHSVLSGLLVSTLFGGMIPILMLTLNKILSSRSMEGTKRMDRLLDMLSMNELEKSRKSSTSEYSKEKSEENTKVTVKVKVELEPVDEGRFLSSSDILVLEPSSSSVLTNQSKVRKRKDNDIIISNDDL